jgi:hypothetical protein
VVNVRLEVIIQLLIALAFVLTWIFMPFWSLVSNIYVQKLTPLGFSITFLGSNYFLFVPNALAAFIYAIVSAVIPLVWRSRYSLYLSLFTLSLAAMLLVTVFIFQSRYLYYGGDSIVPTATGYMYIRIPYRTYFNVPLYLFAVLFAVTALNAATRAQWIGIRKPSRWIEVRKSSLIEETLMMARAKDPISAIRMALDRLGIQYSVINDSLVIGDLVIGDLAIIIIGGIEKNVKEYLLFTNKNFVYYYYYPDSPSIAELSFEQGILLALSKALIKGKPGRIEAVEYA